MSRAVAGAARKIQPAVDELAKVGHVRSVEVDDKVDRVDVVIRIRLDRPHRRGAGAEAE